MPYDLKQITAKTLVSRVDYHDQIGSTNDCGIALAIQDPAQTPLLVLADRQTAGRGRGSNQWWSANGALTFSLVVDAGLVGLATSRFPLVSLSAGLATARVLSTELECLRSSAVDPQTHQHLGSASSGESGPSDVGLKWPNDVHLRGRKVCGILVETAPQRSGVLVVGVGLNINNSFQTAPAPLRTTGISLREVSGRLHDPTELLISLLNEFERDLRLLAANRLDLVSCWQQYCLLRGRTVQLECGKQQFSGVCQGIDDDGALVLQRGEDVQRFFAGVVRHVR